MRYLKRILAPVKASCSHILAVFKKAEGRFLSLILAVFFFCPPSGAGETVESITGRNEEAAGPGIEDRIDGFHQKVSETILNSAVYFDDFFSDERFLLEDNQTRLMIRPGIGYEKDGDLDARIRASLRLKMPRTASRFNLLFTTNVDDENDWHRSALDTPLEGDDRDRNNNFHGAVQYIYRATKKHNLRFSGGVKVSSRPQVYAGARYRFFRSIGNWDFRMIHRGRWYSKDKGELRSTLDFDRKFSKEYLFRQSIDWSWYDNDENSPIYGAEMSLHQYLSPRRAIRYRWSTSFESRPSHRVTNTILSINYRQRIWRDWFLYEITPQIAFPRENDFDFTPGISLQFEIEFGYVKKNKDIGE